ncbi:PAS domain-containing protein [Seleniivibrio sp.]|uniref:PAS domain-containing protein n=1 Tax=Seleniivibrio sp. TaxID=2898801 RepID=UPI0025FBBF52|nr:PAS domain-containing protein [Seleniivibrio sp.]MCD8553507.1 PAS domain-containing protein [Seleniivibrio sp.]
MGNTNAKKLYDAEVRIAELEKELGSIKGMYDKMINQKNYVNMILDNMPIAEFRMDENNIITGVTHTDDTFLGYKLDEFIGRHFSSFLTQDNDSLAYTSDMMKSFHTSKDVTYRMKRKDGGVDYVEVFTVIIGGSPFKKSMAINITERVRINEVLHNLEREKAAILDALRDCVLYLNTDLKIVWANKVAGEMRVATLDMMIGKECFKVCGMLGRYCGNCPVTLVKKYGTRHDSNICINDRSYLCTATPVHDEKGCFIGIVHVIRDITERKRLEKKILSITGEERIRIGQELHDGLGQILTGISYTAKLIEKRITEKKRLRYRLLSLYQRTY